MHDDAGSNSGSNAGQQQDTPWVNGYSSEVIAKMQRTVPDIGVILDWLDKSLQRPGRDLAVSHSLATQKLWLLWQQRIVRNGLLYKRWVTMDKTQSVSKWMEAYAIPDQTAETVAHKIVYEYISRFGAPLIYTQTNAGNYIQFVQFCL